MNCEIQEKCGGCAYGKMPYAQQLKTKTEYVEKQLKKLTQNVKVNYCIGMENTEAKDESVSDRTNEITGEPSIAETIEDTATRLRKTNGLKTDLYSPFFVVKI